AVKTANMIVTANQSNGVLAEVGFSGSLTIELSPALRAISGQGATVAIAPRKRGHTGKVGRHRQRQRIELITPAAYLPGCLVQRTTMTTPCRQQVWSQERWCLRLQAPAGHAVSALHTKVVFAGHQAGEIGHSWYRGL